MSDDDEDGDQFHRLLNFQEIRRSVEEGRVTLKFALHFSATYGRLHAVKYLIEEQHCDPMCMDEEGSTALHFASDGGQIEVVVSARSA